MPKKKKVNKKGAKHFFFKTRSGFYTLSASTVVLMLLAINLYGSANFESDVLGEKDEAQAIKKERESIERREAKKEEIRQEFDVNPEEIKVRFEKKENNIERKVIRFESRELLDKETENELGDRIENEFEAQNEIEIASGGGDIILKKDKVKARTGFPLSIDLATNQLIVTRPDGSTKAVTVLPDKAIENFMKHKKINLVEPPDPSGTPSAEQGDNTGSESAETSEDGTQVSLIERDDQLVYEIKGKKKLKLLGFIPVTAPTTGYVSAETGDVVAEEKPLLTTILDILSP